MDGPPQRGSLHATTLWHFDAAEWAPSTASLADILTVRRLHAVAIPGLLDLPRRVVRDIHCGVATCPSHCRHCIACKWLTSSNSRVLAGAAGDDMGATIHAWLRLVDIAGIEGRENLIPVSVGQHTGSVDVFLGA